ncbi:coat protein [Aspergillus lentulus partitivirus 1]|nr:coat protein [Aspergillus lentulus partitivirus 1]
MPRKDTAEKDPVTKDDEKGQSSDAKKNTGKGQGNRPKSQNTKTESGASKHTPGFAEGNSILNGYNLSVSGRTERILSPFKTDKFFHFVDDSWSQFVRLKPHITERFSLEEFRHMSALMLYNRIESVKFDALGVKQPANTRIPLPRDTRVFQPIWSVLANIGIVEDNDLRAMYIPDGIVPKTEDLSDPEDIENLIACTLYDWSTSWNDVKKARAARSKYQTREGMTETTESNETFTFDKAQMFKDIAAARSQLNWAHHCETSSEYELVDGYLRKVKYTTANSTPSPPGKGKEKEASSDAKQVKTYESDKYLTSTEAKARLDKLMKRAKEIKKQLITPRFDTAYKVESYVLSDGTITTNPGAHGQWMHWDPQLYIDYENMVQELTPMALFSLSMPVESKGTYAWLLPVEKREKDDASVSARLPRASIPTATWVLALLLQSSTLPYPRRSTWYTETDRLQNVVGLRIRYIRAAIKDPTAVEQYGTI